MYEPSSSWASDAGQEALGVDLTVEVAGLLWAAGTFAVAGTPPAVGSLVDAGHPASRVQSRGAGRPKERTSPGHRRLDLRLSIGDDSARIADPRRDPRLDVGGPMPHMPADAEIRRTDASATPVRERPNRHT